MAMMNQRELARRLGITPQHLNAVLNGRCRPSLRLAVRIERLAGVPKERLIPELAEPEGSGQARG
jgi:transcriptional regulator with XRE-family HTH domain